MVESEIGFVAANIPLMGPVFSLIHTKAKSLRNMYASQATSFGSSTATKRTFTRRGSAMGFERMNEYSIGQALSTVQAGGSGNDDLDIESLPMHAIAVRTTLEQNYADGPTQDSQLPVVKDGCPQPAGVH